jgi:hypothetical protein
LLLKLIFYPECSRYPQPSFSCTVTAVHRAYIAYMKKHPVRISVCKPCNRTVFVFCQGSVISCLLIISSLGFGNDCLYIGSFL